MNQPDSSPWLRGTGSGPHGAMEQRMYISEAVQSGWFMCSQVCMYASKGSSPWMGGAGTGRSLCGSGVSLVQ